MMGSIRNCSSVIGEPVKSRIDYSMLQYFDSPEVPDLPEWEIALKVIFYVIAFVIDIVGNSMVLAIVYLNKRMHTTTNILILNLAISDILVGLLCMWVHLGNQISPDWPFGPFLCKFQTFIQVISVVSSVLTLTIISIERFLAIIFPLKGKMSTMATCISIAISWLISVAVATPNLIVRKEMTIQWRNRKEVWCDEIWPKYYTDNHCGSDQPGKRIYYTIQSVVMYCIPVFIMILTYSIISIRLLLRKLPGTTVVSTNSVQERTRRKVIRMLIMILVVFIICWTPQQGLIMWNIYRPANIQPPQYIKPVQYVALYIAYFNSSLNPIIYGGFNENFRKGFNDAIKCNLLKRITQVHPESRGTGCHVPDTKGITTARTTE